jgi:hypothetical protein
LFYNIGFADTGKGMNQMNETPLILHNPQIRGQKYRNQPNSFLFDATNDKLCRNASQKLSTHIVSPHSRVSFTGNNSLGPSG